MVALIAKLDSNDQLVGDLQGFCRPWDPEWKPTIKEARQVLIDEICEWLSYIFHSTCSEKEYHNGIRDRGRGTTWTLDYFVRHDNAKEAGLLAVHVAALRIYTTHLFKYLNGPLRKFEVFGPGKKPHPLPKTMAYLDEGLKKLRAVFVANEKKEGKTGTTQTRLYRGMKMLEVGKDFLDERKGGTEVAPMSTTTDITVAVQYGLGPRSLLFCIVCDNFMQYGAELQWLSAFPEEVEVCYPPFTYLQPTGRVQTVCTADNRFKVVEVRPHIA